MKNLYIITGVLGITAIGLGAFGAHALKEILSLEKLNSFEVGVRYQFLHVLFMLFTLNNQVLAEKLKVLVAKITLIGVVLFSGSIYLLTLTNISPKFLWFVTPMGGLVLMVAWGCFAYFMYKAKKHA